MFNGPFTTISAILRWCVSNLILRIWCFFQHSGLMTVYLAGTYCNLLNQTKWFFRVLAHPSISFISLTYGLCNTRSRKMFFFWKWCITSNRNTVHWKKQIYHNLPKHGTSLCCWGNETLRNSFLEFGSYFILSMSTLKPFYTEMWLVHYWTLVLEE